MASRAVGWWLINKSSLKMLLKLSLYIAFVAAVAVAGCVTRDNIEIS